VAQSKFPVQDGSVLLYHAESDCLWRVNSREEALKIIESEPLVSDVTGIEKFEKQWKSEQKS